MTGKLEFSDGAPEVQVFEMEDQVLAVDPIDHGYNVYEFGGMFGKSFPESQDGDYEEWIE